MMEYHSVPPVENWEKLGRFIFYRNHIRGDGTIRWHAFKPPSDGGMSVIRLREIKDHEVWAIGKRIAAGREVNLYGRGDFGVQDCLDVGLGVKAVPLEENPNHAEVLGWPGERESVMAAAQVLAKRAVLARFPG